MKQIVHDMGFFLSRNLFVQFWSQKTILQYKTMKIATVEKKVDLFYVSLISV
jgi:hypothetical protein